MEISQEDKEKMNEIKYNAMLDKCIDKSYADIIFNPTGFVRGITTELKNDMVIIKGQNYPIKPKKETLERLKYICEYTLPKIKKKQNLRVVNEYQSAYVWVQERLKDF